MANLVPVVTPPNDALGVAVGIAPTVIFKQAIEPGAISSSSCFIVEIPTHDKTNLDEYLSNSKLGNIVPALVSYERINLLDEDVYSSLDFGSDIDSGEQYRTKIYIKPNNLLKPNTTYAALLSKDISLLNVFDPEPNAGNSGDGALLAQGLFKGLVPDTYTITITSSGNKNTASYMWTRASDSFVSTAIEARDRFIEIDKGLKIKFDNGSYTIGDSFIVRVRPADKQQEIFSWNFSTGSGDYQDPDDENSGSLLNLPVIGGSQVAGESLFVTDIQPANADTLVKIPRKANVQVGDVLFVTQAYTSAFNNYTVEVVDGAVAGAEVVSVVGTAIQISIEAGVSTAKQVVDAFNASALVNADFVASTEKESTAQSANAAKKFSTGIDATQIKITFNKDLDPATITDRIKIKSSQIYPTGKIEDLTFSTAVTGNVLTITLLEQD